MPMIYAAACFWIAVAVLLAWGVNTLWLGMMKPKTVNAVLLPGTLMALLARIVALLITGATVNDTALMKDGDKGEATVDPGPKPRLPIIGPVLVALLPMALLAALIYALGMKLGAPVLAGVPADKIAPELPATLAALWAQLRDLITLSEATLNAVRTAAAEPWKVAAFAYLLVCLTVRMAPLPGNVRGHLGAIATAGVAGFLIGTIHPTMPESIVRAWPVLALTVGWLTLLLLASLAARGVVASAKVIFKPE
jgi:hypothetical protein